MRKIAALLAIAVFFCGAFCSGASAAVFANDPTNLSVGARELGMGRAFVGLDDDTSAIFLNPGGLGQQNDWQVSSMSGKYVNTFDYLQLSALYPTDLGTFGLGYAGSSISFSFPSSEVIVIDDERRIIPTGEVSGSYSNTALLMSYGKRFNLPYVKNLSLGGSLKLLSQDLAANIEGTGTASGMELNVGSYYPINKNWSLGASVLNALPAALGGKITWSNNTVETFPALLKVGVAYTNLKDKVASTTPRINAALDYDQYVSRPNAPSLGHLGIEWFPSPMVALRAGIDQSQIANSNGTFGVSNDLSYGLGVLYGGFRFDFAYHMYNNLSDDTTSYFSLSYSPEKKPAPVERKYFAVTSPGNGAVVYDDKVNISGNVLDNSVGGIFVGSQEAELTGDSFNLFVNVKPGGNIFMVEARSLKGAVLSRYRLKVVRLLAFLDVYRGYWAQLPIEQLATLGIITGYPDVTFRPENTIDRAELTTLLVRSQAKWPASSEAKQPRFRDLPAEFGDDPFGVLFSEGKKIPGFPEETFSYDGFITRAEAAALFGLFFDLPTAESRALPYSDVAAGHWARPYIARLQGAGVFDFISGKTFEPDRALSQGEMNDVFQALGVEGSYPEENYYSEDKVTRADFSYYLLKIKEKAVAAAVSASLEAERRRAAESAKAELVKRFKNISRWAAPAAEAAQKQKVNELVTLGVVEVAAGAEFKLDASLTRGDLAAWLVKASGSRLPKIDSDLYSDVKKNNPLAPYIKVVVDAGLMTAFPDGTFRPDKAIDQADAALVTAQVQAAKTMEQAQQFKDVPRNHWAANYIYQAVDLGLVTGYPDGTFQPAKPISRAEGLSVIVRFANLSKRSSVAAPFTDVPSRYWAASDISAAKNEGLIDYIKGDAFGPNDDLQRSEVAYILSRVHSIRRVIDEKL